MLEDKSNLKGVALIITSAILWGINGNVGSFLFENKDINPDQMTMYRLIASGIILLIYNHMNNEDGLFNIFHKRQDRIRLIYFSFFGLLAMQYGYFSAIKHSNASTATILQSLAPFIILIIVSINSRKLPSRNISFALIISFIGAFFLITHGRLDGIVITKSALFFGFLAAFGKVNYDLSPGPLQAKFNTILIMGWAMLISGITFALVFKPWKTSFTVDFISIIGIIFVIILGTLLPFLFYLMGLKIIGAQRASIISLLEPVASTVIAVYFLNVKLHMFDYIGIIMVLLGLIILVLPERKKRLISLKKTN